MNKKAQGLLVFQKNNREPQESSLLEAEDYHVTLYFFY